MINGIIGSTRQGLVIDTVTDSIAIGSGAGANFGTDDTDNIAIGYHALDVTTDAVVASIGIGRNVLGGCTHGDKNVGVGYDNQISILTGSNNVSLGYQALRDAGSASDGSEEGNTAIGSSAMRDVDHADSNYNVAIGNNALKGGTNVLTSNVVIGANALDTADASCIASVAIGSHAMGTGVVNTGANYTVAIGYNALTDLTEGSENTAVGAYVGQNIADGEYNTIVGYEAMANNVQGDNNTALGYKALRDYVAASGGEGDNTAVGFQGGLFVTTGEQNTFVGSYAGLGVTDEGLTGDNNTAIGYASGFTLQTSAHSNTLLGSFSGQLLTTGFQNTAVGYKALDEITTGTQNTVLGANAMEDADGTESRNIAIGYASLNKLDGDTQYTRNVAIGYAAGYYITTGINNTHVGSTAGYGASGALSTGDSNSTFGNSAGYLLQGAAAANTLIGDTAGNALQTGSNNICIGYGSDCSAIDSGDQIVIGKSTTGIGDNYAVIGPAALTRLYVAADGAGVLYADGTINTSDKRTKENINEMSLGLGFINKLCPIEFEKRQPENYDEDLKSKILEQGNGLRNINKSEKEKIRSGFLAQDVSCALEEFGYNSNNDIVKIDEKTTKQQLDYAKFVAPLVKAVQELSAQVEELKNKQEK